jgi:Xaa-Pro aminopeptidase
MISYRNEINRYYAMKSNFPERLRRARAVLRGRRLDAWLVTSAHNRRYLSGFTADDAGIAESAGALLILPREAILLTDGRYTAQADLETSGWRIVEYRKGLAGALKGLARESDMRRVGYEPGFLTCERFDVIRKALKETEFLSLAGCIEVMRAQKTAAELDLIRQAVSAAETVFEEVSQWIRPGMTERQVAWRILEGLGNRAARPSFPPIVASGPNSALPHAVPTDREIREGEPIIIDMGACLAGYCSDMTRTVFLGEPRPIFKEIYRAVRRAQLAAQERIRAGLTGREIDSVARSVIAKAGYGPRFVHSLGHGVGLAVHEAPSLTPRYLRRLRSGMVVTVEPGIYLPGEGGVRLENMAVIEDCGITVLNQDRWIYDF